MMEVIAVWSALPNLHAAIVHFPVALLCAAFGFDAACLVLRRQPWLDRSAAALYLLGAVAAGGAFLSGRRAEDGLRDIPAAVQPHIAAHADMAAWTLATFAAIAAVRVGIAWHDRRRSQMRRSPFRLAAFLAAGAGIGLLAVTADRGGALVYRHGVAVAAISPAVPVRGAERGPGPRPSGPPTSRLVRTEDGGLLWTPDPEDGEALGTVLRPAAETAEGAVLPAPGAERSEGLALRVSGRALLLLPGEFEDVHVEARLDLGGFTGSVGVAHHALGTESVEAFVVETSGRASLLHHAAGARLALDEARVRLPRPPLSLSVSAAGSHRKGMVNGEVVAHGHRRPGSAGGVGLLLDGSGVVRVLGIRVSPLSAPP